MTGRKPGIMIYVPSGAPTPAVRIDDVKRGIDDKLVASIGDVIGKGAINTVSANEIKDQWNDTIDTLMELGNAISQRAAEWKIDEIEVGLTLSAKGQLLFIAEAGAEGSIKLTLRPKN
jgi:hypothetical protein